jgi:hypothetical protein
MDETKKVVARASAIEQEKSESITRLSEENTDLRNQIDNMEMVKEYEGHMNQS